MQEKRAKPFCHTRPISSPVKHKHLPDLTITSRLSQRGFSVLSPFGLSSATLVINALEGRSKRERIVWMQPIFPPGTSSCWTVCVLMHETHVRTPYSVLRASCPGMIPLLRCLRLSLPIICPCVNSNRGRGFYAGKRMEGPNCGGGS